MLTRQPSSAFSSRLPSPVSRLLLLRHIQRRIPRKEARRYQLEYRCMYGHHRPLFRTRHMGDAHGVPQYDIAVYDGFIVVGPFRETVATPALVGIISRGIHFAVVVFCGPYMEVHKTCTLARLVFGRKV